MSLPAPAAGPAPTLVALLRGINVGGHNKVPMAELRELAATLGFGEVRTHLQSGNVIFTSTTDPDQAAAQIEQALAQRLGLNIRVLVRTRDEIAAVVAANPLGFVATDPARHFVGFLSAVPDPDRLAGLHPGDHEPDQFRIIGREIYLWCPAGARETRLTNAFLEKRLAVTATARNWNTVTRLLVLVGG